MKNGDVQKGRWVAGHDGGGAGLVTGVPWARSKVGRMAGYMKKGPVFVDRAGACQSELGHIGKGLGM